eukprot:scaffold3538_cov86-Skeletonema_dohrnii-CCMP3373.AAC.2
MAEGCDWYREFFIWERFDCECDVIRDRRASQLEVNYHGLVVPWKATCCFTYPRGDPQGHPRAWPSLFSTTMNQLICFAFAGTLEDDQVERCSGVLSMVH